MKLKDWWRWEYGTRCIWWNEGWIVLMSRRMNVNNKITDGYIKVNKISTNTCLLQDLVSFNFLFKYIFNRDRVLPWSWNKKKQTTICEILTLYWN